MAQNSCGPVQTAAGERCCCCCSEEDWGGQTCGALGTVVSQCALCQSREDVSFESSVTLSLCVSVSLSLFYHRQLYQGERLTAQWTTSLLHQPHHIHTCLMHVSSFRWIYIYIYTHAFNMSAANRAAPPVAILPEPMSKWVKHYEEELLNP